MSKIVKRTTIDFDMDLLIEVKKYAAEVGMTTRDVIHVALREKLEHERQSRLENNGESAFYRELVELLGKYITLESSRALGRRTVARAGIKAYQLGYKTFTKKIEKDILSSLAIVLPGNRLISLKNDLVQLKKKWKEVK